MNKNPEDVELAKIELSRFRVMKTDEEESKSSVDDENEKGTIYTRSLKYFTREALPRLDNYRHFMSIQAAYRPTLEDLHNPESNVSKMQAAITEKEEIHSIKGRHGPKNQIFGEYGWVEGILIPNLLNICGSILFLQFLIVAAQISLIESLLLIMWGNIVSIITALSVCAISTNGFIKEGGTYVMMSRSLGPEFGIPIGIALLISKIGLCAMYVVGLVEFLIDNTSCCFFDCDVWDARFFSAGTFVISIVLVFISYLVPKGSSFVSKIQIVLFILITAVFIYFTSRLYIGINNARIMAFNISTFQRNILPDFSKGKDMINSLFSLFAIIYPGFAAFLSGINSSENLKDPLKSIPKGTIISIIIAVCVYIVTAIVISGTSISPLNNSKTFNHSIDVMATCLNFVCQQRKPIFHPMLSESMGILIIMRTMVLSITVYCVFVNCKTAVTSLKSFSDDKLYPKFSNLNSFVAQQTGVYAFVTIVGLVFIASGTMNEVATTVSVILLAAYALINFSTFHISLIQPIGWRPTFKKFNMWMSLFGSVLCLCIMFFISWVTALITVLIILAMYLLVTYQKPDVNWGSTTQAQTYNNALLSVYALNNVADHVKNYRPQVLVLCGLPSNRPPLVTFARLITKNLSLMICGNINAKQVAQNQLNELATKARNWLKFNRIKAFYNQVDEATFEEGAKSLMQASGLGKLRPNVLLMGYKSTWMYSSKQDVDMYFNTIHKALDKHIAVGILRVKTGLNFSELKVNHEQISKSVPTVKYEFKNQFYSRRISGENCLSRRSYINAEKVKNGQISTILELNESCEDIAADEIYKREDGMKLSIDMISRVTLFQGKQKKGTIDVWWLYDDGGLTLLLPYIISTRRSWAACKLRVFALAGNTDTLEFEQRNIASLLSKFRIDYSDLTIFSGLGKKPQEETKVFYDNLIKDFVSNAADVISNNEEKLVISESDLSTMQEKTNRHLRLRELLLEHSQDANLIVMTLPIPRKSVISATLYMSWLEAITQDMPPFLLVRGNQTSVLTFYS